MGLPIKQFRKHKIRIYVISKKQSMIMNNIIYNEENDFKNMMQSFHQQQKLNN